MISHDTAPREGFNLSAWALRQQPMVVFLMLVLTVMGALAYTKLPRNEDPPFTIKTMVVSAQWPGATVGDLVNQVTDPIERRLEDLPFLDGLESYTRDGTTVIFVHLRDDTPPGSVAELWYQARKKVTDLAPSLPQGVRGPAFDDEFGDTFGLIYGFTTEGFSKRELRDRLDVIRAELRDIRDIGKITLLGVQEEQIVVELSPRRLAALGLDEAAVTAALRAQNAVQPAGTIRLDDERVALRVSGAFASEESLRGVTLRVNGRFLPLTDVVTIRRIPADPPAPLFRVNGEPAMGLAIAMAPTGNLLEFGRAVQARMTEIAATLPHGIEMTQVADQTQVVSSAISGFMTVLLEAIAIVLAISFLSLGMRAGLVVAVSIPLVLAITFLGMEIAGIGLQRISLGALIIALGLLVDDAMITVEAMVSRLELKWAPEQAASYAYSTTAFPMLTGTLVMVAGFIPVGFAASSAGEYCFSLFMVMLISLSASWVVAVLFSPLLGVWIMPRQMKAHAAGEGWLASLYGRLLGRAIDHRWLTLGAAVGALAVSLVGFTRLEQQFFPASDRPELLVSLTLPQNASLEATDREARRLEALLRADPDVEQFSTHVGAGAIRFYLPMDLLLANDNVTQMVVVTRGLAERDRVRARLEQAFRTDFADLVTRATPLEVGPPVGWPVKYRVTGPDVARVREIALDLAGVVAGHADIRDVNLTAGEPQRRVLVQVDQAEARAVGLSSQDIAAAMATIFSGSPITTVRDANRAVDVVLRADQAERRDIATLADLQIPTPDGRSIPLRQVAELSYGVEEPIIWRRNRQALITVQADIAAGVQPGTVSAQLADAVASFAAGLPRGYRIAEGGAVEEAAKGSESILAVLPVTVLVMATLLMVQLRSFVRMGLAMAMAPFGLIGVVLAMLPTGTPVGFVAQLGIIALAGMIIRNAVILIEEVDTNRANGAAMRKAVVDAARHRARPIMLTALAAILGMIPIAPQVFWGPMAFAIIGGLAVATLLTLTLLPAMLMICEKLLYPARALPAPAGVPAG